uniref:Ig-like domain-containing protein n=1 Tax=Strigops habroptila TaxID=2489341 RepID=A0A672V906_STRHB
MGEAVQIVVFVMAFVTCNALLDLTGVHKVQGTWMGSVTLPCTYMASDGFIQQTLSWSMERDHSTSTIFQRDNSGDHILLSRFRNRVSVPKHSPGNASLLIENLEIPDSGHYTCQVIWRTKNNSVITREMTTTVKVVKVAATKPIIRAGELGLTVPAGARTSLTCVASGSPPISYRWFRGTPGGKALLLSSQAELVWDSLQPSDTGKYYCEAENRAGAGAVQRSDAVELTVRGSPVTQQPSPGTDQHTRPPFTPRGNAPQPGTAGLPAATPLSGGGSEEFPVATGEWSPVIGNSRFALGRQADTARQALGFRQAGAARPWRCRGAFAARSSLCGSAWKGLTELTLPADRPVPLGLGHLQSAFRGAVRFSRRGHSALPSLAGLPALQYALPAALAVVVGAAALGALLIALRCRRRNEEELLYEVAFHSTADVTRLETDGEDPVKCPHKETISKTETSDDTFTMKDNGLDSIHVRKNPEYENLMNAIELEYETERI